MVFAAAGMLKKAYASGGPRVFMRVARRKRVGLVLEQRHPAHRECVGLAHRPEYLQPRILCFGLFKDRDIGVRVFPKCQEILIGSLRLGLVLRQSEHSTELQVRQCADGVRAYDTAMIENLLKLGGRFRISTAGK